MVRRLRRREFVASTALASLGVAGCLHGETDEEGAGDDRETNENETDDKSTEEKTLEEEEIRESLLSAPNPGETGDWRTYRYDYQNTGYNPHTSPPKDGAELAWRFDSDGAVSGSPVVADGSVYFGNENDNFYRLDDTDGGEIWSVTNLEMQGTPTVVGRVVGVRDTDFKMYALDRESGEVLWENESSLFGSPIIVDDTAYIGLEPNNQEVRMDVDAATGEPAVETPPTRSYPVIPAYQDGNLLILDESAVMNYNINQENKSWTWQIPEPDWVDEVRWANRVSADGPPVVDIEMGVFFLAGADESLHTVDLDNREQVWGWSPSEDWLLDILFDDEEKERIKQGGGDIPEGSGTGVHTASFSPCVHEEIVIVTGFHEDSPAEEVYALDASEGELVWTNEDVGEVKHSPVASEETVYVSSEDRVHALDVETGEERWRYELDANASCAPVVSHDKVYVGDENGTLYALEEG